MRFTLPLLFVHVLSQVLQLHSAITGICWAPWCLDHVVLKACRYSAVQVSESQKWTESTLTVTDAHGGSNQCSERVNIADVSPPVWKNQFNLRNATAPLTGLLSDISTLCIWPPNFKYYCWLDVTSNDNDQVCFPPHLAVRSSVQSLAHVPADLPQSSTHCCRVSFCPV